MAVNNSFFTRNQKPRSGIDMMAGPAGRSMATNAETAAAVEELLQ
jgi:hypothetical protein